MIGVRFHYAIAVARVNLPNFLDYRDGIGEQIAGMLSRNCEVGAKSLHRFSRAFEGLLFRTLDIHLDVIQALDPKLIHYLIQGGHCYLDFS